MSHIGYSARLSDIGGSAKSELDLFGMPVFYGISAIDPFDIPGFYDIVIYFRWWKGDIPMGCSSTNTGPWPPSGQGFSLYIFRPLSAKIVK